MLFGATFSKQKHSLIVLLSFYCFLLRSFSPSNLKLVISLYQISMLPQSFLLSLEGKHYLKEGTYIVLYFFEEFCNTIIFEF